MFKMKNLNVVRIVATEEEKGILESQGFEEMEEVPLNYDDMSYNDLKQIGKEKNIEGYYNMKKEDLITKLKELEDEKK